MPAADNRAWSVLWSMAVKRWPVRFKKSEGSVGRDAFVGSLWL